VQTLRVAGLDLGLPQALERWQARRAVHDSVRSSRAWPSRWRWAETARADITVLRAQPELADPVASDPVVSRLVSSLAGDAPQV
jgi:hypothetical protein